MPLRKQQDFRRNFLPFRVHSQGASTRHQTKGLFSQLLTGSVEDVVGPAGGDNKKFIVIVVVEGGVGGVPPVKGHSLGKEPRIVVIVYSCFSL